MKKLLVLAGAVSALAISAANANSTYNINLSSTVNPNIVVTGASPSAFVNALAPTGATTGTAGSSSITLNVTDVNGALASSSGSIALAINTNTNFTAAAYSQNGGLTATGFTTIAYTITLDGAHALASVSQGSSNALPSGNAKYLPTNSTVNVGFAVTGSSAIFPAAATYSDTLVVVLTPTT